MRTSLPGLQIYDICTCIINPNLILSTSVLPSVLFNGRCYNFNNRKVRRRKYKCAYFHIPYYFYSTNTRSSCPYDDLHFNTVSKVKRRHSVDILSADCPWQSNANALQKRMQTNGVFMNGHNGNNNVMTTNLSELKRRAAEFCVDENVRSGQKIGVGTGSTAVFAVERLAELYESGQLKDIICVPSSYDTRLLIINSKLPLSSLDQHPTLDLYIDGADEVDQRLNCIKGGGGCLLEEKIVQSCSAKFFIFADYTKKCSELGQRSNIIPLEVCRSAYKPIAQRIQSTEGGICKTRFGTGKAGPLVTDNGNFILDWEFPKEKFCTPGVDSHIVDQRWAELNCRLKMMPGVMETGLFLDQASQAYFALEDGSVERVDKPQTKNVK